MKTIYKKWKLSIVLITLFTLVINSFTAFANINHLMINTDSNAVSVFALPRSSIASITNTIKISNAYAWLRWEDSNGKRTYTTKLLDSDGSFSHKVPSGLTCTAIGIKMWRPDLPPVGKYRLRVDFASDFAIDYSYFYMESFKEIVNATQLSNGLNVTQYGEFYSGDYFWDGIVDLKSPNTLTLFAGGCSVPSGGTIGGKFSVNFEICDDEPGFTSPGNVDSSSDYQDSMSSALSNLSSSVDSMTEDLSSAAENLEYISTSQNLIIQGIDNVVMHISDQLFAFWNQLFNLIHVPTMAKMDDIISAINNMDLEIEVNLDGLKSTINNMSTAVQNKLQSVTNTITGGYNNSGMQEDNNELSGALDELDNAEQEVLDDVNGYIEGFEYPSFDGISSGIIGALSFFGGFLHSIFLGMGEFGLIITFSLTMIFVLIIVGYHRIRS